MSMIADKIERFILNQMRQQQERVILRRNEMADILQCAPSQISYVLSTRFSNDRGFDVVSRRGLGGYIQITRLHQSDSDDLPVVVPRPIYQSPHYQDRLISMQEVDQSLIQLLQQGRMSEREVRMMHESFKNLMAYVDSESHNEVIRSLFAKMIDIIKED